MPLIQNSQSRSNNGFSLYEILVVAVIIGIMASISVPLFYKQVMRRTTTDTYLQLKAAIYSAQIEAFKRGKVINICAAQFFTGKSGINTYLANNSCRNAVWDKGVLVFIDLAASNAYNSGERIHALRFDSKISIRLNNALNTDIARFAIAPNGQIAASHLPFSFMFSQTRFGMTYSRKGCLNRYGYLCLKEEGDLTSCNIEDGACK